MNTFEGEFPSSFESVARARRAVVEFATRCGFDASSVCDIALAVGEACNNATEHGHVADGIYNVHCSFDGRVLSVEVRDGGRGFNPNGQTVLDAGSTHGRGLGLSIMRALMDDVSYRVDGCGTTVCLNKRYLAAS